MKPVNFEGVNKTYAEDQPEYMPLPVMFVKGPTGNAISCWELTNEEIQELIKTRRIFVSQYTFNMPMQPVLLGVTKEELL